MQHYTAANALLDQHNAADAVREFEAAIRANSKFADAWYGLGVAQNEQLNLNEAIDAWNKAVLLDPKLYQAHAGLANAYMGRGDFDEAVTQYKTLVAAKPNYSSALFGLGADTQAEEVEVRWPDGQAQAAHHLAPDRYYRWIEGHPPVAERY